jgi:hypothetical protein
MSSQAHHKRTKAQAQASKKWAASGRASQARKRVYEKAHGLPTRTVKQKAATQRFAAAGRAAQKRKRQGLKPLPTAKRALAVPAMSEAVSEMSRARHPASPFMILAETNMAESCCVATAIACHLYAWTGILASQDDITGLHLAAGGESGAYIPDLLEIASSSGFAGTRIERFRPVRELWLPGIVAGSRLPSGTHATLILSSGVWVSWGLVQPVSGELEEGWQIEWAV